MRLNRFLAASSLLSRRHADQAILDGRVNVNGKLATPTTPVNEGDTVELDGQRLTLSEDEPVTLMLHKPVGYVVSRNGQGSQTIYDLLPPEYHSLNPVGRLDKNSSGLLLLTSDGLLANQLTHPKFGKTKLYTVTLNKPLAPLHQQMINDYGIELHDGPSRLVLEKLDDQGRQWQVTMHEGRNRQIRRTFDALGYTVRKLHRLQFGTYSLPPDLAAGDFRLISTE